jgi:hypothetical protein
MPDTPADRKKASAGDDAGDKGASSVEPSAPNPTSSSMWKQAYSFIAGRVPPVVPSAGGRGRKRPPPATRWNKPIPQTNQVMTHIELPPYHRPHSPLDLVVIKIIFGRIFEAFQHISQAATTSATADDNGRPPKKLCQPSVWRVLVPR